METVQHVLKTIMGLLRFEQVISQMLRLLARVTCARLLRGNQWLALYWSEVRLWNPRARADQFARIPLLLPHELVGTVWRKNATNEAILARTSFGTLDIGYMAGLEG